MKKLTATIMALVLAGGSGLALAERGKHDSGRRGGDHHNRHQGHYGSHYGKHYGKHYSHPGKRYGHYKKHHGHYYPRHHYRTNIYYNYDPYLPLGAALVGTAIGYTLSEARSGCYGNCGTTTYTQTTTSRVSACYRIERYPDGSERRIELPPSQCY